MKFIDNEKLIVFIDGIGIPFMPATWRICSHAPAKMKVHYDPALCKGNDMQRR